MKRFLKEVFRDEQDGPKAVLSLKNLRTRKNFKMKKSLTIIKNRKKKSVMIIKMISLELKDMIMVPPIIMIKEQKLSIMKSEASHEYEIIVQGQILV